MLTQLVTTLGRDGVELRISRDVGQFRDVLRSAAPDAEPTLIYPTISAALEEPPMKLPAVPPDPE